MMGTLAFHDCVQPVKGRRLPPGFNGTLYSPPANCSGGLCVGMHNGPHEGGPASYPIGSAETGFTRVSSTMTVPDLPQKLDGICYYIWTDIFFGDMSQGRMNQFVPQLILGNALDGSSGPPDFLPHWGEHKTWSFGAHYFFETLNASTQQVQGHAAYGDMYAAKAGETLFTSFEQSERPAGNGDTMWTLKMGVVGDSTRVSTVEVEQPYMGLGAHWDVPTASWRELNYTNLCVNACWELYGADDRAHLPSSGSRYDIKIEQGKPGTTKSVFPWVTQWDEDEGAGKSCATNTISETHNATTQHVVWDIKV